MGAAGDSGRHHSLMLPEREQELGYLRSWVDMCGNLSGYFYWAREAAPRESSGLTENQPKG